MNKIIGLVRTGFLTACRSPPDEPLVVKFRQQFYTE